MNVCGQCGAKIVRIGLCPECLEEEDDEDDDDDQDEEEEDE